MITSDRKMSVEYAYKLLLLKINTVTIRDILKYNSKYIATESNGVLM